LTVESLISALAKEHGNQALLAGKYVVAGFAVKSNEVMLNLKDGKKLDAADLAKVEAEIDNWSVLERPMKQQLDDLKLVLVLPK